MRLFWQLLLLCLLALVAWPCLGQDGSGGAGGGGALPGSSGGVIYFSAPPYTLQNATMTDAPSMMANYNRIISDGNTAFNNLAAQIAAAQGPAAQVPSKAILPFNLATCPSGWQIADGTAGAPDLRGYFIQITNGTGTTMGTVTTASTYLSHRHPTVETVVTGLSITATYANSGGTQHATGVNAGVATGNIASGNAGTETRPKNVALLFCMKT